MFTKHTLFLYFSDFLIFYFYFFIFFNEKQNKAKTEKQTNKIMLNKVKHKTGLTQKQESKTHK